MSIVNLAVFEGVNETKAVALIHVATRTEYVPFADMMPPLTHPIDGVTVPAVREEIVNVSKYSQCDWIPMF